MQYLITFQWAISTSYDFCHVQRIIVREMRHRVERVGKYRYPWLTSLSRFLESC